MFSRKFTHPGTETRSGSQDLSPQLRIHHRHTRRLAAIEAFRDIYLDYYRETDVYPSHVNLYYRITGTSWTSSRASPRARPTKCGRVVTTIIV